MSRKSKKNIFIFLLTVLSLCIIINYQRALITRVDKKGKAFQNVKILSCSQKFI